MGRMIGETTNLSRNLKYIILQPIGMIWQKFGRWQWRPWPSYKPSAKNSKHVIKKGKIVKAMQKLRKEHEQRFGISCGFQFEIALNSKVENLTCAIVIRNRKLPSCGQEKSSRSSMLTWTYYSAKQMFLSCLTIKKLQK